MKQINSKKLESSLKQTLSSIFINDLKDPLFKTISITETKLLKGNEILKVYYRTSYSNLEKINNVLNKTNKLIRYELASKIVLQKTPKLEFILDTLTEKISKINDLFEKIKNTNN